MRRGWAVLIGVAAFGTAVAVGGMASALAAPAGWSVDPVPHPPGQNTTLAGVAAVGANEFFAVGRSTPGAAPRTTPLILHNAGKGWKVELTPSTGGGRLNGISAAAPKDIWAVGSRAGELVDRALIEHYDGTRWRLVAAPPVPRTASLNAVSARSPVDAWAVGTQGSRPLIERWNGSVWSVVPAADTPDGSALYGVAAISFTNVWAVGGIPTGGGPGARPLIEHWDGTAWTVVPLVVPEVATNLDRTLRAITYLSAYNVWTVGGGGLILHFGGAGWTSQPSNIGIDPAKFTLSGVAGRASNDMWTVGYTTTTAGTLSAHFDGTQWTNVPGPAGNALYGAARARNGPTVAVGSRGDAGNLAPLIARTG